MLSVSVLAQDCAEVDEFINEGKQQIAEWDLVEAFEIFNKSEQLALEKECFYQLMITKISIGVIYSQLSKYGEALDYYHQALAIIEKHPQLKKNKSVVYSNIGYLYYQQENSEKEIEFFEKAYAAAKEYNDNYWITTNLADAYKRKGMLKKALEYLEENREKINSERNKQLWEITYAEVLYLMGETEKAKKITNTLYVETQKDKKGYCNICVLQLLTRISADQSDFDRAIEFAKKGLQNTDELNNRIELYLKLGEIYSKKGDYRKAARYKDSVIIAKDSLSNVINHQLFQINRVKFEVQEYQNQLKTNNEKRKRDLIIFITGGLLILVVFIAVYNGQRNRIIKQRQEKKLAASKQKITKLELKELKSDISKKNRKLMAKALYLSDRNEIIEKVIESLADIPEVRENKKVLTQMRTLKQQLRKDAEWDKFINHFESINPQFTHLIKTRYPDLNNNDMRFLCHMYMNLDLKEISTILGISLEAAKKRKQRIARKMGVSTSKLQNHITSLGT